MPEELQENDGKFSVLSALLSPSSNSLSRSEDVPGRSSNRESSLLSPQQAVVRTRCHSVQTYPSLFRVATRPITYVPRFEVLRGSPLALSRPSLWTMGRLTAPRR